MIIAQSTIHVVSGVLILIVLAVIPGVWTFRSFAGKKAWPGPGKVPRIHLRGEPAKDAAPFPSIAFPLLLEVLYFAVVLLLDTRWHINFAGTGANQQSTSQNLLGLGALVPIALAVSLGASGRPRFLIAKQYKSGDGLNPNVVAMTRADAPPGSSLRPWLRQHTVVRVSSVTIICAIAAYYSAASLNSVLRDRSTPPWWSLILAVAAAGVWLLIALTGIPPKPDEAHPRQVLPSWIRNVVGILFLVGPLFISFSNVPTRSDTGPIIPISLQVIGKVWMFFGALAIYSLVTRQALMLKRNGARAPSPRP